MNHDKIKKAFRRIGLALNVSHNTVATDLPEIELTKTSWRINHEQEIKDLEFLESFFNNKNFIGFSMAKANSLEI